MSVAGSGFAGSLCRFSGRRHNIRRPRRRPTRQGRRGVFFLIQHQTLGDVFGLERLEQRPDIQQGRYTLGGNLNDIAVTVPDTLPVEGSVAGQSLGEDQRAGLVICVSSRAATAGSLREATIIAVDSGCRCRRTPWPRSSQAGSLFRSRWIMFFLSRLRCR